MLTIGELAKRAGTTVRAVRHYHAQGLLAEPPRDHSGYRRYGAAALVRLIRIRRLRDLGLPLERVRELLDGPGSLDEALDALDAELAARQREIARQRRRLAELRRRPADPELPPGFDEVFGRLAAVGLDEDLLRQEKEALLLALAIDEEVGEDLLDWYGRMLDEPMLAASLELSRRMRAVADLDPADPEVGRLGADFATFVHHQLGERLEGAGPVEDGSPPGVEGALLIDWINGLSPSQRRVLAVAGEYLAARLPETADLWRDLTRLTSPQDQ
ncbi:DNA-binding transcriptional regulator, MerR family [Streptoalloteichus tenebrarius]|uniref:DNA-binding transcriptional regulator, MerR family n=1 Tax=Streptoalloteichus tenebrarius (strain ATCC 17920 / DSM 40477 / JCM 4838 / CBS 697.72 / NBRC 16177 / NCIMB 11028 / NRRL B-12390 / A12253. 1 / ISP 5477) TaxID=1933 RepID=A0ABT1I3D2_STRSD|nr:MerR family transcriptional regulator [Streptoalloteichus tenebrarius]MCP2262297.1 DNA-binding transcriptional regulator, MerR family [Streptoalloteichus tenebrarius]BFF01811.1 MerR family transcriptional regulator [Streptoalloteichus tenebrarius]